MFEHLNEQSTLSWSQRIRYFIAASFVVGTVFLLSLWMIAKAANYFGIDIPFSPVAVTYDANEDGVIFNEIDGDPSAIVAPKESETESLQP